MKMQIKKSIYPREFIQNWVMFLPSLLWSKESCFSSRILHHRGIGSVKLDFCVESISERLAKMLMYVNSHGNLFPLVKGLTCCE